MRVPGCLYQLVCGAAAPGVVSSCLPISLAAGSWQRTPLAPVSLTLGFPGGAPGVQVSTAWVAATVCDCLLCV